MPTIPYRKTIRQSLSWLLGAMLVSLMLLVTPGTAFAAPGDIMLASTSYLGVQADTSCLFSRMSADGKYLVFTSDATNLVPGIASGRFHVYRKDLANGAMQLCSASSSGTEGSDSSSYPDISVDGSYVVFHSYATNLIDGHPTSGCQVFRKDMRTGEVALCSASSGETQANMSSQYSCVSYDGRYVAFVSAASNLVPGLTTVQQRIYRKDLAGGAIVHCSASSSGVPGNSSSNWSRISSDGRYVAFTSDSSNLIDGRTTSHTQVFRKDLVSGETLLCSSTGSWVEGSSPSYYPDISANGRYVVFNGRSTNLASGTSALIDQVYRKDLQTGQIMLCSRTLSGIVGNDDSTNPSLSADGQYVAFDTIASNLYHGDTSVYSLLLRKDLSTGEVACASASRSGALANHNCYYADISADGRYVGFGADATNLIDGRVTANRQIFRKELSWYSKFFFAEGYTGDGFQEYLCLGNPGDAEIFVTVGYLFSDGTSEMRFYAVPAGSRLTVDVNAAVGPDREVSMRVVSEDPCVAERPMYFEYGRGRWTGGHDVVGNPWPNTSSYFAEGYTGSGFDEWVCVLNPGDVPADLTFRFQTQEEGEVVRTGYTVEPNSRATFKVNEVLGANYQASLALESDQPVVAERPMYFDYLGTTGSRHWTGGHCVMGAPWLGREYYFAEGYTGDGFEEWLTLQNPNPEPIEIDIVYQFGGGAAPIDIAYYLEAGTRRTAYVPQDVGPGVDVSAKLSCDQPFLAERPMYFRYSGTAGYNWTGGHCVIGAASPASDLFLAEGYTGTGFEEWLCIQVSGSIGSRVRISYFTQEAGPLPPREEDLPPNSRTTFLVNFHAGPNYQLSCRVEVLAGSMVVVERPLYFNFNGAWTGGHDVIGYSP